MTCVWILYQLFPRANFKTGSPINPLTHVQLPELNFRLYYKRITNISRKTHGTNFHLCLYK